MGTEGFANEDPLCSSPVVVAGYHHHTDQSQEDKHRLFKFELWISVKSESKQHPILLFLPILSIF